MIVAYFIQTAHQIANSVTLFKVVMVVTSSVQLFSVKDRHGRMHTRYNIIYSVRKING